SFRGDHAVGEGQHDHAQGDEPDAPGDPNELGVAAQSEIKDPKKLVSGLLARPGSYTRRSLASK
ncbi:hypothetical protein, partial [Phenylobacterium sp.]|uniref:hypothetical protein n=1 Tax=Phenylobacterium sp. TaxID=1871053 RepID=UPI0025D981E3